MNFVSFPSYPISSLLIFSREGFPYHIMSYHPFVQTSITATQLEPKKKQSLIYEELNLQKTTEEDAV